MALDGHFKTKDLYIEGVSSADILTTDANGKVTAGSINPLEVNGIQFDLDNPTTPSAEGLLAWNDDDGTLNLGMRGGGVNLQIGLENLSEVRNVSGSTITNGKLVYVTGSSANRSTIDLADSTDADKIQLLGMATEDIDNNSNGYVTIQGVVRDIDTSGYAEGASLYLSTNGDFTDTHPASATEATIKIGTVRRVHASEGEIELNPYAFSIGNNFDGTIRQSVINKSTGTNSAVGFTAVNDQNYWMTVGIGGSNNSTFANNAIFYGPGYNDNLYAVDGAKSHKWYNDPTDSHNNSSLNYLNMELDPAGILYLPRSLSASSGVYTDSSKGLTSTPPTTGVLGYWAKEASSRQVKPATDADYPRITPDFTAATLGTPVSGTFGDGVTDTVVDGVLVLDRGGGGGFYNTVSEGSYAQNVSPADTEWNSSFVSGSSGWSTFDDVQYRNYTNFRSALDDQVGNNIIGEELVMHVISTDQYYKVEVTGWEAPEWTWTRTEITPSAGGEIIASDNDSDIDYEVIGTPDILYFLKEGAPYIEISDTGANFGTGLSTGGDLNVDGDAYIGDDLTVTDRITADSAYLRVANFDPWTFIDGGLNGLRLFDFGSAGKVEFLTLSYGGGVDGTQIGVYDDLNSIGAAIRGENNTYFEKNVVIGKVVSHTATPGADLEISGDVWLSNDDDVLYFGTDKDLKIYKDSSDSYIENSEGDLFITNTDGDIILDNTFGSGLIKVYNDLQVIGDLDTGGGRVVKTNRITGNTTLDTTYHNVFCDTDGGAFTVTLPASPVDGQTYRIINCGSNNLTIDENGKSLLGSVTTLTVIPSEVMILTYETTEGWW